MKNNISRQHMYLFSVSLFLFLFVLIFSFSVLVPSGKEYRLKRLNLQKIQREFVRYENFHDDTLGILKDLKSKNVAIITAFENRFNAQRFEKHNKNYFSSLSISKVNYLDDEDVFSVYEVNTTSKISSPTNFYKFLDSINKSDWIIGVNFPINFKREGELIKSSFTMKVYCNTKDNNSTVSVSVAK